MHNGRVLFKEEKIALAWKADSVEVVIAGKKRRVPDFRTWFVQNQPLIAEIVKQHVAEKESVSEAAEGKRILAEAVRAIPPRATSLEAEREALAGARAAVEAELKLLTEARGRMGITGAPTPPPPPAPGAVVPPPPPQ